MKPCISLYILLALTIPATVTTEAAEQTATRSTPVATLSQPTIIRIYDVRDLTAPGQDFPLSNSAYGPSFVSPMGQPATAHWQMSVSNQSNMLVNGANVAQLKPAEGEAFPDDLIKLIEDTVDQSSWKDMGGTVGYLRVLRGLLVIQQTEANHHQIAQLLSDIARDQGGMVRVNADWLLLSSAEAAKLLKQSADRPDAALVPLDPTVLQNLPAGAKRFSAQTLSRSGQTVHVISGLERSIVTSTTPIVTTGVAAYSADVSSVGSGVALEVNSRINWDQQNATVTLYSTFSDPAQLSHADVLGIPFVTTRPAASDQVTHMPTVAGFQPFSRVVQDMRTTVRVPLGVPVIVGGMTLQPSTKGGEEGQLLLILKVVASK